MLIYVRHMYKIKQKFVLLFSRVFNQFQYVGSVNCVVHVNNLTQMSTTIDAYGDVSP